MIGLPAGTRIWIAAGVTDMRADSRGWRRRCRRRSRRIRWAATSSFSAGDVAT